MTSLYHEAILAEAKVAIGAGRLEAPDASLTIDNPLCGDRVTLDIALRDGQIAGIGHEVKGCLLCQAAASLIARHADDRSAAHADDRLSSLKAYLRQGSDVDPETIWPGLSLFEPARAFKSRHRCVTLPFEALAKALHHLEEQR
ncbi:MAG: iron-sulfur cluster assembly scaffold protein [Geminicoccaceae bacterium]